MTKIRPLVEVMNDHPGFRPAWEVLKSDVRGACVTIGFDNPKIGKIERVVVCDDDGKPLYDQYRIEEGPKDLSGLRRTNSGAVIVPYYTNGQTYIGLITRFREAVIDPKTGKQGSVVIELPRGLRIAEDGSDSETAIRELGEETGKVAKSIIKIGMTNPNTAFYASGVSVFAVEVDQMAVSSFNPDSKEPILRCEFIPLKLVLGKLADQEIFCSFTQSALSLFTSKMLIKMLE